MPLVAHGFSFCLARSSHSLAYAQGGGAPVHVRIGRRFLLPRSALPPAPAAAHLSAPLRLPASCSVRNLFHLFWPNAEFLEIAVKSRCAFGGTHPLAAVELSRSKRYAVKISPAYKWRSFQNRHSTYLFLLQRRLTKDNARHSGASVYGSECKQAGQPVQITGSPATVARKMFLQRRTLWPFIF